MSDNDHVQQILYESLAHFGMAGAQLTPLKATNNLVYRLDIHDKRYVLRIHQSGRRKPDQIKSELAWLQAIHNETDLRVPEPAAPVYSTRSGEKLICGSLLHWVDGSQVLPSHITLKQARMVGVFAAQLHNHSITFITPPEFTLPRLDRAGMFGKESLYPINDDDTLITGKQHTVLEDVAQRVHEVMATLDNDSGTFGVIHADFIWKNILFNGNRVGAIDFDDCAYGYYLYDLAPTLLGYMDEPNYLEIRAAIWDGYTLIRPLPESFSGYLETLVAGRYALSCLWIAANQHNPAVGEHAPEIIAHRISELGRYLATGNFRRGEIII